LTATRHPVLFILLLTAAMAYGLGNGNETGATGDSFNPDLDYAQARFVKAANQSGGLWRFEVTVRHRDEGWGHYADAWQVVDPATGEVLGERILAHPHDREQPFTRSLSGVNIPEEVTRIVIRARCNVHGFGGREVLVNLSAAQGDGFSVLK